MLKDLTERRVNAVWMKFVLRDRSGVRYHMTYVTSYIIFPLKAAPCAWGQEVVFLLLQPKRSISRQISNGELLGFLHRKQLPWFAAVQRSGYLGHLGFKRLDFVLCFEWSQWQWFHEFLLLSFVVLCCRKWNCLVISLKGKVFVNESFKRTGSLEYSKGGKRKL